MTAQSFGSRQILVWIISGILSMVVPYHGCRGEDNSTRLKSEFLQNAPPAWRTLQRQLLRSRGKMSYRTEYTNLDDSSDKTPPHLAKAEFRSSGFENRLVVIERMQRSNAKHVYVAARNPNYQFRLKRPVEVGGEYLIDNLRKLTTQDKSRPADDLDWYFYSYVSPLLYAPFWVDGLDLSQIVAEPSFRLDSIRKVHAETTKSELVEIHFSYPQKGEDLIQHQKTRVLLDPENHWSILEYQFDFPDSTGKKIVHAATVKYSDEVSAKLKFKYPIEVQETLGDAAPPRKGDMALNVFTLEDIKFGDIPGPEFTLSAFGLPEVVGQDKAQAWSRTVWMLIVINAALVLCGLWWYLSKRTRQPAH